MKKALILCTMSLLTILPACGGKKKANAAKPNHEINKNIDIDVDVEESTEMLAK